jgi:hypothetical protein
MDYSLIEGVCMYRIILAALFLGLAGCATTGDSVGNAPPLQTNDPGNNAAQTSARNIAPITSYVNTHY